MEDVTKKNELKKIATTIRSLSRPYERLNLTDKEEEVY